jgi:hypothetical protein
MSRMRRTVLLATDGVADVRADAISRALNQVCKNIRFAAHTLPLNLGQGPISNPTTYQRIAHVTRPLLNDHALVLIVTELPYDNNYFFDSDDNIIIASAWGWESLTNLPRSNGLVGFIINVLAQDLDNSFQHDVNTGCVYDFLWDKRGVDAHLRSGLICRDCLARLRARAEEKPTSRLNNFDCTLAQGLEDLTTLLDEVAIASKREVDVLARWQTKAGVAQDFDVFLCHNSDDKPSVRRLYQALKERKVVPWFDEEHLRPGRPWQAELEATIPRIRSAAVIVGPNGNGPWQDVELAAFLREFVDRACPVIPVLMKDAGATPPLPIFLRAFTWVDFRKNKPDPWKQLLWGITGTKPP